MTETEWLVCHDPFQMVVYLGRRISDRKLRLFACACWRNAPGLPTDPIIGDVVRVVERYADGQADEAELTAAQAAAAGRIRGVPNGDRWVWRTLRAFAQPTVWQLLGVTQAIAARRDVDHSPLALRPNNRTTRRQADLLRHILGNPFQPPPTVSCSSDGVRLARAVQEGDLGACGPLHDALLEDGLPELAAHFWQQPPASLLGRFWRSLSHPAEAHPKGCWALDAILRVT